jgi:hypothetical protein
MEQHRKMRLAWMLFALVCALGLWLCRSTMLDLPAGRMACGLVLIHLLPGSALARRLRPIRLLEALVFGLALSPLLVTLFVYLASGLLGLSPGAAIGAGAVALLLLLALPERAGTGQARPFPWTMLLPMAAGLLLLGATTAHYLSGPSNMLIHHGLYHTSGINQVMAGLLPPDHIHLTWAASDYQWPAWIVPAVSSLAMEVSPPLSATISRFLVFLGLLGMGTLTARHLGQPRAGRVFSGLLVILGMNLLGGLNVLWRAALNPEVRRALFGGAYHPGLYLFFTPDAMADHLRSRTASIIIKLANFSFILPGYLAILVAMFGAVRLFQGRSREGWPLLFLGTAAALLIHPVLGVMLALPLPLALLLTQFFRPPGERFPLTRLAGAALAMGLAALPALPYLLPAMGAAGGGDVGARVDSDIALAMAWLYLPLLPLAVPPAVRAFRQRDPGGVFIVLSALVFAVFILVQQVKCDWYHLYLLAIPLGLLAGGQLGRWYERLPNRGLRVGMAGAVVLLVLLGPLLRLQAYSQGRRADATRYDYATSRLLDLSGREGDLARACRWVRVETEPNAVLVEAPKKKNREELASLTGRRVLVGQEVPASPRWRHGNAPPEDARALARRLLEPGSDKTTALEWLAGQPDPVYLFIASRNTAAEAALAAEYGGMGQAVRLELDLPSLKIYRVLPR